MDIKEIQSLIKFVAKSGASEVKLEMKDVKITIRTGSMSSAPEPTFIQQMPIAQAPMIQAPVAAVEVPAAATPVRMKTKTLST